MSLPLFLISKVEGTRSAGTYIIRTKPPRFVGRVEDVDGLIRVYVHEAWDEMSEAEMKEHCLEMKNHYYFKYVKK